MKLYNIQNLVRRHGARTVLDIGSLEILPEKVYTLIGPNGAGKTSLLKILAFLDLPSSGSIEFMGKPVVLREKQLCAIRRDVVLLDQSPIMFTGTVWKNVEFGLKVRRVPPAERKQRIEHALELVGMERFAGYDAQGLSGGETKRVALARALVLDPAVLLCDEPTANVDSENQESILGIIEQANKEYKTSIIFSTHYLSQGQQLADHTLLLQNGSLSDLVNENIFRVSLVAGESGTTICQLTGQLHLVLPERIAVSAEETRGKIHIDSKLIEFVPADFEENKRGTVISGHVSSIERHGGGAVRVMVETGVKLFVMLPMDTYRAERPGIGDRVTLFIPHEAVQFNPAISPLTGT